MRHTLILMSVCALMAGCTSIDLSRSENIFAAPKDTVIEHRETVPLPMAVAWRNTLAKARECWQMSFGVFFKTPSVLEVDPYDPAVGEARMAVRMENAVVAVLSLRPDGPDATIVWARVPDLGGTAYFYTEHDVPFVGDWARGTPVECKERVLF